MKIANRFRSIASIALAVAFAAGSLGWIPQEKGKRKIRMADAVPELNHPLASQIG